MRLRVHDDIADGLLQLAANNPGNEAAAALAEAIRESAADYDAADRDSLINLARDLYCAHSDDNIEVDDQDAVFSRVDAGVWVQGWLFVSKSCLEEDE